MYSKTLFSTFLLASLTLSASSIAQDTPPKAALCAACHGANGAAPITPTYPKINGQNKGYLISALKAYRDGNRKNAEALIMAGQARGLSDAEIEALSAYFASK